MTVAVACPRAMGAVVIALTLCGASVAEAQQQQFGQPGTYVTWGGPPPNSSPIDVTYFIGGGFTGNEMTLIRSAAAAWTAAGGGVIRLVETGSSAAANVTVNFGPGGSFGRTTLSTSSGAGTYPNGLPWLMITGAAIQFNGALNWWDGTGTIGSGQRDFYAAALDLFGQSLGLGGAANSDTASVMQNNLPANQVGNHVLSPSDTSSLQLIYGAPEASTFELLGVGLLIMGSLVLLKSGIRPV